MLQQFRFDFRGKEGKRDNSFIKITHDDANQGEVTVALSHKENADARNDSLDGLFKLSRSLLKKAQKSQKKQQDELKVETEGFDSELGMLFSSKLEESGVVPKGSTQKFKEKLVKEGHEIKEKDLTVFMHLMGPDQPMDIVKIKRQQKEHKMKKLLGRFFRKGKPGRSK